HMFEMLQLLAETNLFLLIFSVLIFDIPRYTLSLLSLALFGAWRRSDRVPAGNAAVSVIIPTFNGGSWLGPPIASLHRQTLRRFEIIVVDDGSTDQTRAVAEQARAWRLVDMVICHGTRCGRSAAINAAARFASGDLLLTVDADTVFEPTAVARLAAVFSDPRVGGASCKSRSATNRSRCGPDCKASSTLCRSARGGPYWTSWRRSPVSPGPVPCIDAILSCGKAASTSAPARIWSTACRCVAWATSSVSCRKPGRKQTARSAR